MASRTNEVTELSPNLDLSIISISNSCYIILENRRLETFTFVYSRRASEESSVRDAYSYYYKLAMEYIQFLKEKCLIEDTIEEKVERLLQNL